MDEICPSVGRWLLEQTERADSTGRDPVDHIAGDLIIVDLVIDRADRVVADEALDLRIVREWGNGRDELALVNELARVHAATMTPASPISSEASAILTRSR